MLSGISRVEVHTDQVVVAMETKTCEETPGISASFSNFKLEADLQHNDKGILTSVSLASYLRDLLCKTVYCNRYLTLFGPCSIKMDGTLSQIFHKDVHHLSQCMVTIATGLVNMNVGQEHILCLQMISQHLQELGKEMSSSSKRHGGKDRQDSTEVTDLANTEGFTVLTSADDLRSGEFQYVMEKDAKTSMPAPGEIMFCTEDKEGNSSMTWTYSQPRVISDIASTPIPFSIAGEGDETMKAPCVLQYWEPLIQQFVDYADLELSQNEVTTACLPDIHSAYTKELAISHTWKIVIKNVDGQVFVLPSSLAVSMKVDSAFIPSLIPNLQVGCTFESLDVHFINHVHCLGKETPTKLIPFFMSSCYPATGEFAVLQMGNILLAGSHFMSKHSKTQLQFSSTVCLDLLEFKLLTMQRVLAPFEISGTLFVQPLAQPPVLDVDIICDPITVRLGQGVLHNVNCSLQAWTQIFTKAEEADEVIFGHYVICNDTQQPIRFGQVGTDENLLLQPREMHQYGWRSHKMKQEIHICIDGTIWKWCDPFDINSSAVVVRSVTSTEQNYTLIITVKRLSNVQNQIIISGQLVVCNRLCQHLEVKVMTSGNTKEHHAVVGGEHTIPSYILEVKDIIGVKFRTWGSKGLWSKETAITGESANENNLVKITSGELTYHIWCQVFIQKHKGAQQIFVVLCPLYTLRSHLPYPLYINIDTSKLNTHSQVEAPGRGQDLQLQCQGGDIHHALTFQFSSTTNKSSSGVTLSTGLIEQLQRNKPGEVTLTDLQSYWREECWFEWPYTDKHKLDEDSLRPEKQPVQFPNQPMGKQPTIDLNVSLSELWPGCQTVLVDITPSYLITNTCDHDLIVMGNEDLTYDLGKGQTISPPKLEGSFHVGVKLGDTYSMSAPIPISEEEVGAQRYRNDIGKTLFLDSYVQMPVFADFDGHTQVYFLTVSSIVKHQIRVLSVKETYCFTNLTKYSLDLCPFTLPKWSKKVDVPVDKNIHIPSHHGCHGDQSDLQPLTFHPLLTDQEKDNAFEIDHKTEFINYLSIQHSNPTNNETTELQTDQGQNRSAVNELSAVNKNKQCDWSFPFRLSANENGSRMSTSVTTDKSGISQCLALCVVGQTSQGCTYFTIHEDQAPACYLENKCDFPITFGQTLMNLSLSGTTIQEQTELVTMLPTLAPGGSTYYTPPFLNNSFPQIQDRQYLPKFHIAAYTHTDNISDKNSDFSKLIWSQPIDLHVAADNFVTLAGVSDIKVHINHVSMVTLIIFEPITKADVSAREIRSRLKGKETTVVVETESSHSSEKLSHDSSHNSLSPGSDVKLKSEGVLDKKVKDKSKPEIQHPMQVSVGLLVQQFIIVIQDELTSTSNKGELLRLTMDDLFVAMYPASALIEQTGYHRNCVVFSAGDIQLDNQIHTQGNYDFPVVMTRENFETPLPQTDYAQLSQMHMLEKHAILKSCSLVHAQIVFGNFKHSSFMIDSIEVSAKPLNIFLDDTFIFRLIKEIERFIPVPLSKKQKSVQIIRKLPPALKILSRPVASPVVIGHLTVQPISILLSIHASLKLFIASDNTPLKFGGFERINLRTTQYQLVRAIAMHYASGALFRAGAVVGSLEILGNPTGLVRSIGTGVADFFRMPYRGITRGPGAFVVGVSHGMSSMVKNVTTGMLKSVTNFASSVSRNMDRLSLDGSHLERQEANRRHRPDGVGNGLMNGLTGLGISLLEIFGFQVTDIHVMEEIISFCELNNMETQFGIGGPCAEDSFDNIFKRNTMSKESIVWAKLPGLPPSLKWPVKVVDLPLVYSKSDNAWRRLKEIETIEEFHINDIEKWRLAAQKCLRKKPATYEAFQNDIQWAIESVEGELEGHGHPSEKDPGEINRWASNEDVVQLKGHVQPYEKDIGQVDRKTSNDDVVQLEGHVQPFEEDPGQVDREASNDDVKTAPKHIFIYLESSDDEFDQCNVETRNEVKHDTTLPHETVRKRKYISSDSNSDSNNDLTRMKMDKLVPLRKRVKVVPQSDNDSDMSDEFPMLSQTKLKYCPEVNSGADNITINERGIAHPALLETTIRASDSLPRVFAKDMRYEHIYISGVMKSKISNSGQNKKSDRVYNSRHPCPYCKETKSNFSHHILAKKHKNEPEVIEINNAKDENERKYLITKLCLKAAHNHNMQVLEGKRGELFLFRRLNSTDDLESDSDDQDQGRTFDIRNYGPCPSCFGWVKMKSLLRHNRSCTSAAPEWSNRALQVQSDIIAGRLTSEASENLIKEVFPIMYKDDISKVAKEDNLIVNLGNQWLMRNRGNEIMRKYYTSSMMRLSARLKLACQDLSQTELEMTDYLAPVHFETVLKAVLACCHVEEMEENLKAPSNAVKLGFDIKRMLSAKLSQGIMSGDEVKQKEATDFLRLMDLQWSLRVTRLARGLLVERSFNQQNELPRPSDVKRLFEYLQTEIKGLDLTDASFSNFRNVAILSLARITLHNRRRCHEVQAMRLSSYVARKTGIDEVGVEIRGELTKFERQLLMRQEFVVIRGKTGKGVPVIIPPDVVCALKFLSSANIRISAGIPQENKYVFSNKGVGVFRGYDAIREVTQAPDVGLQMPDLIRSSKMRKYMATMLQALNTTEAERQWVVDHLGHTMNVHQVHYRQTSDVLERVDVAKVLLIQDLGLVAKYKGKKIQDIQIEGAVAGLADQPIQSFINTDTSAATSLVTGMGKGLVGVFTKPIGGAAEFVSQTGQGILQGTGLSQYPQPRVVPVTIDVADFPCGQLKYALKLLQSLPSNDILCCMEASHIGLMDTAEPVTLILTPEILFVVNHEEDAQQQSFAIQELDCGVMMGDNPVLSIVWRDAQTIVSEQFGPSNTERVTAFIDGITHSRIDIPPIQPTDLSATDPKIPSTESDITPSYTPSNDRTAKMPDNNVDSDSQRRELDTVVEDDQLSNCDDSDSNSSEVCGQMTSLPLYEFTMDATKLAAFLAIFNISKHKLEGTGFAL